MATGGGIGAVMKIEAQQRDCKSVGGRIVASLFDAIKQLSVESEGSTSSDVDFDYRPAPLGSWHGLHNTQVNGHSVGIESVSTEYTVYPQVWPLGPFSGLKFN